MSLQVTVEGGEQKVKTKPWGMARLGGTVAPKGSS